MRRFTIYDGEELIPMMTCLREEIVDTTERTEGMMAAINTTSSKGPKLRGILVFNEPALLRKNRIQEKLEDRGIEIVRTYEVNGAVPSSASDISIIVMQAASVTEGGLSKWKAFADKIGARFFRVPHQTSMPEWRGMEEWIGRALESAKPRRETQARETESTEISFLKSELTTERAEKLRLEARVIELEAQKNAVIADRTTIAESRRKYENELAEANRERRSLEEQLATFEERSSRINKAYIDKTKQLEEQNIQLRNTLAAKDNQIETLKRRTVVASSDSDTDTLRELLLKYDSLVSEELIDAGEAWAKMLKKVKGDS